MGQRKRGGEGADWKDNRKAWNGEYEEQRERRFPHRAIGALGAESLFPSVRARRADWRLGIGQLLVSNQASLLSQRPPGLLW